jgi:NAD(P)-dependent dehydrogenase (short-subunit alcohol dehydrogenase family)
VATVSSPAVVVGGASGIGAACAAALRRDGWPVVVVDLRPGDGELTAMRADVRDDEAVGAVVSDIVARHGGLGAVVYAAGTARVTPILEIEPREWELVRSVNLDGAYSVLRHSAPHLPRGGSFTLISSVDSAAPVDGLAHYSAAKAGAEALIRAAALELGERGIRCNSVRPGVVRTPLMAAQLDRPGVSEAFVAQTPLGRIADGDEIAEVVCFLTSPAARWITGVSLPVDGGMSLREHPRLLAAGQPVPDPTP